MPARSYPGLISIKVLLILVLVSAAAYFFFNYLLPTINKNIVEDKPVITTNTPDKNEIDISNWVVYPNYENDFGWTIKHPVQTKPLTNEKNTQITLEKDSKEAILIVLKLNRRAAYTNLKDQAKQVYDSDTCGLKTPLKKTEISEHPAFEYKSDCSINSSGDEILLKSKNTLILASPYKSDTNLIIESYVDAKLADQDLINLSNKIISTVSFVKPADDETSGSDVPGVGFKQFSDKNAGFSLKLPEEYRSVEDPGWENAVTVLYKGGQSYDLIVQKWSSKEEYKNYFDTNYPDWGQNVTVIEGPDYYFTLFNLNNSSEVKEIINSFKLL